METNGNRVISESNNFKTTKMIIDIHGLASHIGVFLDSWENSITEGLFNQLADTKYSLDLLVYSLTQEEILDESRRSPK